MSDQYGKTEVLWVDDDSPNSVRELGSYRVTPVQTVQQAEDILENGRIVPNLIVMDLVVPQGGWVPHGDSGKGYLKVPGIDFIRHIKGKYGDQIVIGVLTAFETEDKRRDSLAAGAVGFYEKTRYGLPSVLEELSALRV